MKVVIKYPFAIRKNGRIYHYTPTGRRGIELPDTWIDDYVKRHVEVYDMPKVQEKITRKDKKRERDERGNFIAEPTSNDNSTAII